MGSGQGWSRLLNQAKAAGAEGLSAGAALGLDDVGTGGHQIHRQLLLLIEGQPVGHGDAQNHLRQQLASAAGELKHLGGIEDATEGIKGVVVANFHHCRPGSHSSGKQLGIDCADANRQAAHGSGQLHQLRIAGHIDQIGTALASGPADPLHTGSIKIGEASDHLEQAAISKRGLQGGGQLLKTRLRNHGNARFE